MFPPTFQPIDQRWIGFCRHAKAKAFINAVAQQGHPMESQNISTSPCHRLRACTHFQSSFKLLGFANAVNHTVGFSFFFIQCISCGTHSKKLSLFCVASSSIFTATGFKIFAL
jgi:hypothetical protein